MILIITIIILVIILLFVVPKFFRNDEKFDTTSALTQLYANDVQDSYLTGDAWKYTPPLFSYGYLPTYFNYGAWPTYYYNDDPTLYLYNYVRRPLYTPTRWNRLNYYYYRPYGLRKDFSI
jgi:hypothetical protein